MYKITFFVPKDNAEQVKAAMFLAGGGKIGNYDHCSFEVEGTGQFRALEGANPYLGELGKVEKVTELRVEMVCPDHLIKGVVQALKEAHPYETPAYDVYQCLDL